MFGYRIISSLCTRSIKTPQEGCRVLLLLDLCKQELYKFQVSSIFPELLLGIMALFRAYFDKHRK